MRRPLAPALRLALALALALLVPLAASAAELKVRKATAAEVGQQATCPVMNHAFTVSKDTPVIDYKGKPYFFCCESCIGEFRKNPGKFASAAHSELTVRAPTADELGKKARCAVQGTEFEVHADTPVIDYKGKPNYLCCSGCISSFKANPDRFAAK